MKQFIIIPLILCSTLLGAQNSIDALRYSRINPEGTARFQGMGGAMGAIGGDFSSITFNPAATAVYRNSEFTFSTAFNFNQQESNFQNELNTAEKLNFNLGNIGYVGSYKGDPNGWKNYSFAVGYNRVNSFNSAYRISGSNPSSTIVDSYVNQLNQGQPNVADVEAYAYPFGPSQAYWLYLIDPVGNQYARRLDFQESILQTKRIETTGRQSETFFSFGGNYLDRLYLGGTIGMQNIRFEQTYSFEETYTYDPPPMTGENLPTSYLEQSELVTTGTGINFKIGGIYRITNELRIGASVHTPTFFGLTDSYVFSSDAIFSDTSYLEPEVNSNYNYSLRTPSRYTASLAYVMANRGIFNLDYEYIDYSTARFNDTRDFQFDYSSTNNEINDFLRGTHNVRAGVEVKADPFIARAGIRYEQNPFSNEIALGPDESSMTYSVGGGFRAKNYTIDISYVNTELDRIDNLYDVSPNFARINNRTHQLVFSLGWKW